VETGPGYYGGPTVVEGGPTFYGGIYERGPDVHVYAHRGFASRGAAHGGFEHRR